MKKKEIIKEINFHISDIEMNLHILQHSSLMPNSLNDIQHHCVENVRANLDSLIGDMKIFTEELN